MVVDDSAFMRKAITMMLESDPMIKVIGTARDGEDGIEKVRRLKPDLVTMDIEMPRMDGLTALREIMAHESGAGDDGLVADHLRAPRRRWRRSIWAQSISFPSRCPIVSLDIVKIKEDLLAKIKDIARRKHVLMSRAPAAPVLPDQATPTANGGSSASKTAAHTPDREVDA